MATLNENLTQYASLNPTQKTHTQSTESLCKEIESGNLVLPVYQTGLRWTKQKNVDLYNFMLRGKAPVAPISMNVIRNVEKAIEQVSFIHRNMVEGSLIGKNSVTDGQQRLTCLYKAYTNDPEFEDIVFDVSRAKFQVLNASMKNYQIPVGILLNKNVQSFYEYMNNNSFLKKDITKDAVLSVRKKFFSYNFVINMAEDLDEDEQVNWFEVLNNAGSQISRLQMKFAKMLVQGLDIYPEYIDIYKRKILEVGWEKLFTTKDTEVSFPIATLNPAYEVLTKQPIHALNFCPIPSDTKEVRLTSLDPEQLREIIKVTLHYLDKTLLFVKNEGLKKPTRMDYITYLLGVFVYNGSSDLDDEQKNKVIEWYNNVSFTNMSNSQRRKNFDSLLEDVVFNFVTN
ncbi:GmrSD restriction endonuclease domain-containing protein [Priestia megaterium]|uniref:GmrSD restriction endonuclease domain-containing protein n=1 Tax=Priestia megaterium TaxID=1404 RepID=UPI00159BF8EF|nr:DUF262 domain-containing protein [Priestia megaterium]